MISATRVCLLSIALACGFIASSTDAFERCGELDGETGLLYDGTEVDIVTYLGDRIAREAPAARFDTSKRVVFRYAREGEPVTAPTAITSAESGEVVVPYGFFETACRLVTAHYLYVDEGEPGASFFTVAFNEAVACEGQRRTDADCFDLFARALEADLGALYGNLPEYKKNAVRQLVTDLRGQILAHEFSHLLLGHHEKVREGALQRIDAEFEADFYAIQWALNRGSIPSGLTYFYTLRGLFDIAFDGAEVDFYEDPGCRARNAEDVTQATVIAPIFLLRLVNSGDTQTTAENAVDISNTRTWLENVLERDWSNAGCGRLPEQYLRAAARELLSLVRVVERHITLLNAESDGGTQFPSDRLDEVHALLEALLSLAQSVDRVSLLANTMLGSYVERAMRTDGFALSDEQSEEIEATIRAKGSAESFGRAKTTLAFEGRIRGAYSDDETQERLVEGILYDPLQPHVWATLALWSLDVDLCKDAMSYGYYALTTAEEGSPLQQQAEDIAFQAYDRIEAGDPACVE